MNTILFVWLSLAHAGLILLAFIAWKERKENVKLKSFLNGYTPRNMHSAFILGAAVLGGFALSSLLSDKREFKEIVPLPPIKEGENE